LKIVREYVQYGKYVSAEKWRTSNCEISDGEKDDVWDDFDDEEELARKNVERKKRKEDWDKLMDRLLDWDAEEMDREEVSKEMDRMREEKALADANISQVTLELATKIIQRRVPDFVDRWRRSKIKSLWGRAYSDYDETEESYDSDPVIRFSWWDECAKSKSDDDSHWGYGYKYHPESQKNSYIQYEEYKWEPRISG